jgi:hypothetical protein
MCRGETGPVEGWKFIRKAAGNADFSLYRPLDDPELYTNNGQSPRPRPAQGGKKKASKPGPVKDWHAEAVQHAALLTPEQKTKLVDFFKLPLFVLDRFPLIGFLEQGPCGPCWTFPEVDKQGNISGLSWHTEGPFKGSLLGSKRGLSIPSNLLERPGPLYIVEGWSDTAAATAMGVNAIGVPSAGQGGPALVELLTRDRPAGSFLQVLCNSSSSPVDRPGLLPLPEPWPIVVVAENDHKDDGTWPGRDGAMKLAGELKKLLKMPVYCAHLPRGIKDTREWFIKNKAGLERPDDLVELGIDFVAKLDKRTMPAAAEPGQAGGLALRCFDDIEDRPFYWLIEGWVPKGMIAILAGEGGHGKSFIACHILSCLSRGVPCFGLEYAPPAPMHVVYANCEDDPQVTIRPRLLASKANMKNVSLIEGKFNAKGEKLMFSLADVDEIRFTLSQRQDIGLVIVDPVGAFAGDRTFDANNEAQARALLQPLANISRDSGVPFLLIMHFNKGKATKVAQKIMGSVAFRNQPRAVFAVVKDDDTDKTCVLGCSKLSVAENPESRAYQVRKVSEEEQRLMVPLIKGDHTQAVRERIAKGAGVIEWLGNSDLDLDSAVRSQGADEKEIPGQHEAACNILKRLLAEYDRTGEECTKEGNKDLDPPRRLKWWRDGPLKRIGGHCVKSGLETGWVWTIPR